MANDPLTFSSGCRDGTTLCRVTVSGDADQPLQLNDETCVRRDEGLQCGDAYLYAETPKTYVYLPGLRRGVMSSPHTNGEITIASLFLPQKNPADLAPWRDRLIKQAEELAKHGDNIKRYLALAEATGEGKYYESAMSLASIYVAYGAAYSLREIADRWPVGRSPASLLQRVDKLLPEIAQLPDPEHQVIAYRETAIVLAKAGRSEQAREIAARAYQIAQGIPNTKETSHTQLRVSVVTTLALVGHAELALAGIGVVQGAPDYIVSVVFTLLGYAGFHERVQAFVKQRPEHAPFLADLAKALGTKKKFPEALAILAGIKGSRKEMCLMDVARQMVRAGMVDQALRVDAELSDVQQLIVLSQILEDLVRAGRTERVRDVAVAVERLIAKDPTASGWLGIVSHIGEALLFAGLKGEVRRLAQRVCALQTSDPQRKSFAAVHAAILFAKVGDRAQARQCVDEALQFRKQLKGEEWAYLHHHAAVAVAWAGDLDLALELAKGVKRDDQGPVLHEIARALVASGRYDRAAEVARGISGWPGECVHGLTLAAMGLLRSKHYMEAIQVAAEAARVYAKEGRLSGDDDDIEPEDIAVALADAGRIDLAVALVDRMPADGEEKIRTLAQIAKRIPQITEEQRLAYQVFDNYRVFEHRDVQARSQAVWAALRTILQQAGMNFPEPMLADYPTFLRWIGTVIKFQTRVQSFRAIHELWQNRPNATPRVALLLTGSFNGDPPIMDRLADPLVQSGQFRVFSRAVKNEMEFHAAIAAVHAEAGAPIHTLVLAGMQWEMGKPVHVHPMAPWCAGGCFLFGGDGKGDSMADKVAISVDDFADGNFSTFASHIDPAGQLVLDLCVGGHGGRAGKNLANAFARLLPPTFAIYSVQDHAAVRSVAVRPDRRLAVSWNKGPVYNTLGRYGIRVRQPVKEPWLKVE